MRRIFILTMLMAGCFALPQLQAQEVNNEWAVGVRWAMPNYIYPLDDVDDLHLDDFGGGLQFDVQRYFSDAFYLSLPLHLTRADRRATVNNPDGRKGAGAIGAGLALGIEPLPGQSWFDPQFFAGVDVVGYSNEDAKMFFNFGTNLNFRLGRSVYLSPRVEYRMESGSDEGDLFDHLQAGIGLNFRPGAPKINPDRDEDGILNEVDNCPDAPGPLATMGCPDADGDNIADKDDRCPSEPGPAATQGCPDSDGDGVADTDDDCPDVAGLVNLKGCPDRDGDGIRDMDDECPDTPGTPARNGCPAPADADGDGVADAEDRCPNMPGTAATQGCPDNDGDGIPNMEDRCPDVRGSRRFEGCPDSDGDGVADPDDRCPEEVGTVENRGCPEIEESDRVVLVDAIQNVNFETASATLTASSRGVLDQIVDIMGRYPAYSLTIGGHTDSVGDADMNQRLSERRAKSVYDYLVSKGVSTSRLSHQGFGESQPIADNRYRDGREQNRRVEFDLSVQ